MVRFYASGKRDAIVPIEVEDQEGVAIAMAEDEHITGNQFRRALETELPQYNWRVWPINGFWRADGYQWEVRE